MHMEIPFAFLYLSALAIALQVITIRICAHNRALWTWRRQFQLAAFIWVAMALAKKGYIDDIFPPSDALEHERVARDVAEQFTSGHFADAFANFGIGNDTYRFMLGVFYALTNAPEIVTYAVNGALGFWGLLSLLDVLCRQTKCVRLPGSVVGLVGFLPSGLVWTTANLKEGPVLWGICMMCYWMVPAAQQGARGRRILPIVGLLVVMAMRPHIAIAWLVAIAAGNFVYTKRSGLILASAAGTVVSIGLLSLLVPAFFDQMIGNGVSAALSSRYDDLSTNDRINGAALAGSSPLPVISGLTLILFRPWPTEVERLDALLAGVEVWFLAVFGLVNWTLTPGRLRLREHPGLLVHVVALVLMGYFFSYMYNMGLVVRQRLMCFPAVLALYVWPLLAKQQAGKWAGAVPAPFAVATRRANQSLRPLVRN